MEEKVYVDVICGVKVSKHPPLGRGKWMQGEYLDSLPVEESNAIREVMWGGVRVEKMRKTRQAQWDNTTYEEKQVQLALSFHSDKAKRKSAESREGYWDTLSEEEKIERGRKVSECLARFWASERGEALRDELSRKQSEHIASLTPEKQRERMENSLWKGYNEGKRREGTGERISAGLRLFWAGLTEEEKRERLRRGIHSDEAILKKNLTLASSPTIPEFIVGIMLERHEPGRWYYNGDGRGGFIFRGKVPDFVDREGKRIVEVFGDYWHSSEEEEQKINHYAQFGYKCIVIWEADAYSEDAVVSKLASGWGR